MARRAAVESDFDDRASRSGAPARRSPWRGALRVSLWTFALAAILLGAIWLKWQAESFLEHDSRFIIAPRSIGDADEPIHVSGLQRASMAAVLAAFDKDRGASLYRLDTEKRRLQLRRVDWVRDATVRRVWPNRLDVRIFERVPVAFIRVAARATGDFSHPVEFRPMLIDGEGMILPALGKLPSALPLLTGVREDADIEARKQQVELMQRVLRALSRYKSRIVEVDVSRPRDIRVGCAIDGRQFTLILGDEQLLDRFELFLREYDGMRDQLDPRKEYDLTSEKSIIAIEPEPAPGTVRK